VTVCGHPIIRGLPHGLMSRSRVLRLMRVVAYLTLGTVGSFLVAALGI